MQEYSKIVETKYADPYKLQHVIPPQPQQLAEASS
jgi:hypothetical protein